MNAQKLLQSMWEANTTLNGLCPVNRLFFEQVDETDLSEFKAAGAEYPYCVFKEFDDDPVETTSKRYIDEIVFELTIYADSWTTAKAIQRASRTLLRDASFKPDDNGEALNWEKRGGSISSQDNYVFIALDEYVLTISRPR